MSHDHCACGETKLGPRGFTLVGHRLHGGPACARQHTLGEVARAVADGCRNVQMVASHLGSEAHMALVGEALVMLRDADIVTMEGPLEAATLALAPGIESTADAEKKLAHGGKLHAGDLVT